MNIKPAADLDQWHLARWSRFTASENYKLLVGNGSNMFGAGAMTYIEEKVLQMTTQMWERPEMEENKTLLHGKIYEYPAYKYYVNTTGNTNMIYLGDETPLFLEYEPLAKDSGGSPDAITIISGGVVGLGVEIKCPKNPMVHFNRVRKWKTMWDLKENYNQCYTQIQNLMMITGAKQWDFISYDERQIDPNKKGKIIEVFTDQKFQDNLELRLRMAVKEKYRIYEEYMNS